MKWCSQGSKTYPQRMEMFFSSRKVVEAEIHKLEKVLNMIKFKCWYYDQAIADGSEDRVLSMIPDGLPDEIRAAYENAHIG
jgi:hypothetical protein